MIDTKTTIYTNRIGDKNNDKNDNDYDNINLVMYSVNDSGIIIQKKRNSECYDFRLILLIALPLYYRTLKVG